MKTNLLITVCFAILAMMNACQNESIFKKNAGSANPNLLTTTKKPLISARDAGANFYSGFNFSIGPAAFSNSNFNSSNLNIGQQIYQGASYWTLNDIKSGFFSSKINPDIIYAFTGSAETALYSNMGVVGATRFYLGPAGWKIVSICTGDFDGNGNDELITAIQTPSGPKLYRSTDINSIGTEFYSGSSFWSIKSVTAGDFNRDGRSELIIAFNSPLGPAMYTTTSIFPSTNGVWWRQFYQGSTYWTISSVTAGDFDKNGVSELYSAFNGSGGPAIYMGDNSRLISRLYLGAAGTSINCLNAGKYNSNGTDQQGTYLLLTGMTTASGPQIYYSSGTNLGTIFYQGTNANNLSIQTLCLAFLPPV